jgi:hypothetical protein
MASPYSVEAITRSLIIPAIEFAQLVIVCIIKSVPETRIVKMMISLEKFPSTVLQSSYFSIIIFYIAVMHFIFVIVLPSHFLKTVSHLFHCVHDPFFER